LTVVRALRLAAIPLLLYGCAAPSVSVEMPAPRSHTLVKPGRPGFVIAAAYRATDPQTGDFAAELARRTGFALVVSTEAVRQGSVAYEQRVQEAAQGPLAFYAEIRGSERRESANRIEIATSGVDATLAARLRTLFELIRDAHLRGHPGAPRVEALVEPATRDGILPLRTRALHLDLPRAARTDAREPYLTILAEFLAQAATLPAGR